jgi:potassium efflux system protein
LGAVTGRKILKVEGVGRLKIMKNAINLIFWIVLLSVVPPAPGNVLASQQNKKNQTEVTHPKPSAEVPHFNEIIPLSSKLSGQLAKLKNKLNQLADLSLVEKEYAVVAADVESFARQYKQIKKIDNYNTAKVYVLSRAATNKKILLEKVSKPLIEEMSRVDLWKTQWLTEKKHWDYWQSSLLGDQAPEQLKLAFGKGHKIIDTGLDLVMQRLEKMLSLQAKGGEIVGRIDEFDADLHFVISTARQDYLFSQVPPLISFGYLSQFRSELWSAAVEDLRLMPWPGVSFLSQYGWIFLLQFCLIVLVMSVIRRNKKALNASEHWKFFADRPVSSALFINIVTLTLFVAYAPYFNDLKLAYIVVGGIASVRVLGLVIVQPWKKQAAYIVMGIFVVSELLMAINLPLPLSRLYIFLVSLIVLCLLVRWTRQSFALQEAGFYIWLLRVFEIFFVVILVAELWGNAGIAAYLFNSTIVSMAIALPFMFFIYMMYGGLHWVFFSSPVWQVATLRSDAGDLVQKVGALFVTGTVGFALLPAILVAWNVYDSVLDATTSIYSYGFSIGTVRLSVGMIVAAATILYCAYLTSRILPKVLLAENVSGRVLARGVKRSIAQLIRYFIMFIGFVLAISFLGFDFTKLTLILSAFGVGIGFGLQGVVNNFVCGLILLFERPLTEGDIIEVGTEWATIKKIGLRSTTVTTFDEADLIIPNADLINNKVMNWTLTNRQIRLRVPIGVAYGSDVSLTVETILTCAKKQTEVLKAPVPHVLFMDFGDSSLDFELRVWIQDVQRKMQVRSALYYDIEQQFRELNIVIPFPQRDLHLPGFDNSAGSSVSPSSTKEQKDEPKVNSTA